MAEDSAALAAHVQRLEGALVASEEEKDKEREREAAVASAQEAIGAALQAMDDDEDKENAEQKKARYAYSLLASGDPVAQEAVQAFIANDDDEDERKDGNDDEDEDRKDGSDDDEEDRRKDAMIAQLSATVSDYEQERGSQLISDLVEHKARMVPGLDRSMYGARLASMPFGELRAMHAERSDEFDAYGMQPAAAAPTRPRFAFNASAPQEEGTSMNAILRGDA